MIPARLNPRSLYNVLALSCLVFALYSVCLSAEPGINAEPGDTAKAAATFTAAEILRDGDTRVQSRMLDLVSLSPASQKAFVEVLKVRATPEELRQLSEKLGKLRADFRENPISYGVSGGLRLPIALMFLLNVHITIQGFNSAFIMPDNKEWFAETATKANMLGGLLVAYAGGKDLMIFKRERGMSRDRNAALRGLNQTLDQLQTAIDEAKNVGPTDGTAVEKTELFPEIRSLLTTLENGLKVHPSLPYFDGTSKENRDSLRGYLDGLATRYSELRSFQKQVRAAMQGLSPTEAAILSNQVFRSNLDPSFRLRLAPQVLEHERQMKDEFAAWLAAHPDQLSELLKLSFEKEDSSIKSIVGTHRISRPAKWTLAVSTIYTFVWGAMTNMGKEPNLIDLTVAGTNLNQLVRDFWLNQGNVLGAYAFTAAAGAYVLTLAYRNIKHDDIRKHAKPLSLAQWNFIRGAALSAKADLDAGAEPSKSEFITKLSASELLSSLASRVRTAKIDPVPRVRFTSPAYAVCRDTLMSLAERAWDRLVWEFR